MSHSAVWRGGLLVALLVAAGSAHAGASCLLFPLSCLAPQKKYGEEVEAKILGISKLHTDVYARSYSNGYVPTPSPLENTRDYFVAFQVGMTRYIAWREDTVVQMAGMLGGYTPKPERWIDKTIKMRFMDENWMGLKTPVAAFKTPEGKEWKLVIIDIIGPDGVDECPPALGFKQNMGHCKPQAKVDRAAREQEILGKMKAEGKDGPVWEQLDAELAAKIAVERGKAADRKAGAIDVISSTTVQEPAPETATASSASATMLDPEPAAAADGSATPAGLAAASDASPAVAVAAPAPESPPPGTT
jgi:hypothetical protein